MKARSVVASFCVVALASVPSVAQEASAASDGLWQRDRLTGDWRGVRSALDHAGIELGLQDQSEAWHNFTGGLRTGNAYDGLTTASMTFDLERLAGWNGAKIFANGFAIYGHGPSVALVGNLQFLSNIEATPSFKVYDLWFEQELFNRMLSIRLGQEGANDEMMVTEQGALFINSSFGFPGLLAADLPSGGPNYPLAAPFVRVRYTKDDFSLTGAVFTADPAPPGDGDPQLRDAGGLAFRLDDNALSFLEAVQKAEVMGLPGTYKLGTWYMSGKLIPDELADLGGPAKDGGFGFYGIVDQMLWREPGRKDEGITAFLLAMGTPATAVFSDIFIEAGFSWKGLFDGRNSDVLGVAVAYVGVDAGFRHAADVALQNEPVTWPLKNNETVIEATYLFDVTPWWQLQPDLQIVIDPRADLPNDEGHPLANSVTVGVRSKVVF